MQERSLQNRYVALMLRNLYILLRLRLNQNACTDLLVDMQTQLTPEQFTPHTICNWIVDPERQSCVKSYIILCVAIYVRRV